MRRITSARAVAALAVLAGTTIVAGCGGADDRVTVPSESVRSSRVMLTEYAIAPAGLVVAQGDVVEVENAGDLAHNLVIERGPDPNEDTEDLAATPTFTGGESRKLKIDVPPGDYALACTVGAHRELGMVGTITVIG